MQTNNSNIQNMYGFSIIQYNGKTLEFWIEGPVEAINIQLARDDFTVNSGQIPDCWLANVTPTSVAHVCAHTRRIVFIFFVSFFEPDEG